MKKPSLFLFVSMSVIAALAPSRSEATPTFQGLGDLPGGGFESWAYGVSGDGSVVVGQSVSSHGSEAFRWTATEGMVGLGDLLGGVFHSGAEAVSDDGKVIVGVGNSDSGAEGFRWTASEGMIGLGDLPGRGFFSDAKGVSADGSVIVGESLSFLGGEAFRWTATEGMVGLGDLPGGGFFSDARGISADGKVIVGGAGAHGGTEAFSWSRTDNMVGLGDLPNGPFYSYAMDVSADGSVIVGHGGSSLGTEAFRWSQSTGMIGLGDLPGGDFHSTANGISADGSVIVGSANTAKGPEAFVWDSNNGMRALKDILVNQGVNLDGWNLWHATDVSNDGSTIVGYGINPSGQTEAFIAGIDASTPGAPLPFLIGDTATRPIAGPETPDSLTFLGEGSPDSTKPTIILTHGWQPGEEYWDDAAGKPTQFPLHKLQDTIQGKLGSGVNVFAYQWPEAYTETSLSDAAIHSLLSGPLLVASKVGGEFLAALSFVQNAGADLSRKLTSFLGEGYSGDIHMIGHSLGTMVNAEAAHILSRKFDIDQVTLLDPPLAVPGIGQSYFYDALPKGTVEYVDNFYALPVTLGFGEPLPAAAPDITALTGQYLFGGELVFETHTGVHENFYRSRIKDENGTWITAVLPERFTKRPYPKVWDPSVAPSLLEYLGTITANGWESVVNTAKDAYEGIINMRDRAIHVFVDAKNRVIDVVGEKVDRVKSVVRDAATGAVEVVVDTGSGIKTFFGNSIGKVLDLKESSPVVVKQTVTIPEEAELLTFDFIFANPGDGDWITVHFGDQLLWSFLGENFVDEIVHASIAVEPFAGQTGDLYFTLNSVGEANAEVLVRNVGFVGTRQATGGNVPEPATLLLLMLGFAGLSAVYQRKRANA